MGGKKQLLSSKSSTAIFRFLALYRTALGEVGWCGYLTHLTHTSLQTLNITDMGVSSSGVGLPGQYKNRKIVH